MQKAKELAKGYLENADMTDIKNKDHMDGLKPAINNLLHMYLPDDITLKEIDVLAMVIQEMVFNPYSFVRNKTE